MSTTFTTTSASGSGGGYSGRYTSVENLEAEHGQTNIAAWSNVAGAASRDDEACERAIRWAEDQVDMAFSAGPYAIPFTATGASLPGQIEHWATSLAAWKLYQKRGLRDSGDKAGNDLSAQKKAAEAEMTLYVGQLRHLSGVAYRSGQSNAVALVEPTIGPVSDGANLIPAGGSRYTGRRMTQGGIETRP